MTSRKLMLAMKFTAFLITVFFMSAHAAVHSQAITLSGKGMPLKEIFAAVEKQTGYVVFYGKDLLAATHAVSIQVAGMPLRDFLDAVLRDQPVSYQIEDKTISLMRKPAFLPRLGEKQIKITGVVRDSTGYALAGASVKVRGTRKGTVTDATGKFYIEAATGDVLIVSFVGYESREIEVTQANMDVVLKAVNASLKEVTVSTGYWQSSKALSVGNIAKVNASEIEKQPVSNPLLALQGRMAGVYIHQGTGVPGGGVSIQIRGMNSIRGNQSGANDPLYIVDGVQFPSTSLGTGIGWSVFTTESNPLNNLNPADIESIEVLKDAAATSIYGSRGANGVVLITTKKGKEGNTKVDINAYKGFSTLIKKMDLLHTPQYLEMRYEAHRNSNVPYDGDYALYFPDLNVWSKTRDTDWQDVLIGKTANTTSVQASVSGGTAQTQFLIGSGYFKEGTVFPGDFALTKASARFSIAHTTANQKFQTTFITNYTMVKNNLPAQDLTGQALRLAPNAPELFDAEGKLNWENNTWTNPLADTRSRYKSNTNNLISNMNLAYKILPGLRLSVNAGYSLNLGDEKNAKTIASMNPYWANSTGTLSVGSSSVKTWVTEPQLEYTRSIGAGSLTLMTGGTFQQTISENSMFYGLGYTNDAVIENLQAAPTIRANGVNYSNYKYNAVYGRIHYNYDSRYILELTGRRDGSSRFGPNRQFANFGAAGAGWIFSNEQFLQGSRVLSFGKLRTSYGTTGSDRIADYGFMDIFSPTNYPYQGTSFIPSQLVNPDYAWEINRKLEAAVELGFFRNNVQIAASWYRNRTSNQLVGYSLPDITGFSSVQYNIPATVQNTGLELELQTRNFQSPGFSWTSSFNISFPRNKLIAYPNIEGSSYAYRFIVGRSLYVRQQYHVTGVDPQTGEFAFTDVDGSGGLPTYPNDLTALTEVTQRFHGGFQNTFSYKGLQLDVFLQFVKQTGRNWLYSFYNQPGITGYNQPAEVMNRWQKPGDITDIPRFNSSGSDEYSIAMYGGDISVSDASFIRIKNLSLSWKLPERWMAAARLQQARIYLQGQNLFTITRYKGMDPENQMFNTALPPLRVLTAGIQITL